MHALFKALLFLTAGAVIHSSFDNQDIRSFSAISVQSPFLISSMNVCSLSLMGFPFMSGFYSKDLILEILYSLNLSGGLMMMLMLSTFLTGVYSLRLYYFISLKSGFSSALESSDKWSGLLTPIFGLLFGVIWMGSSLLWCLFPEPQLLVLSLTLKAVNFLLVGFSLVIFISLVFFNLHTVILVVGESVFSELWFLGSVQGKVASEAVEEMGLYYCFSDQAWLEYSFSKSFSGFLSSSSSGFSGLGFSDLKLFLWFLFILIFLFETLF